MSQAEDELAFHLDAHKIEYEREYKFHPERKWRSDFFVRPDILIEVEGGVYVQGRHSRGSGFVLDCEKYNAATLLGFRVFRFVPKQHVTTGLAIETIVRALA